MRGDSRLQRAAPLVGLVARFGQFGAGRQLSDNRDPGSLSGLPSDLVLAAHIGAVDELLFVGRCPADRDGQGGIAGGLEAHRHLAEV